MVTSELEKIDNAAVAQADEIHKLSRFLSPYLQPRSFCKELPESLPKPQGTEQPSANSTDLPAARDAWRAPFHHLRDEFGLLLGIAGCNLVLKTWERHHLAAHDREPEKLRPALLKLFSTAARIAAPRGSSQALKAIVRGFEVNYFPVTPASVGTTGAAQNHRFSLLALIQTGQGAKLLTTTVLKTSAGALNRNPSATSEDKESQRLRREFLFESSCRAKSWTEAYRQSRLLSYGTPRPKMSSSMERRLIEVYRQNLGSKMPGSKKKQLLADIARLPAEYDEQPQEFALRAVSSVAVSCRPGEDDALLCQMLPASDPRWRISLRHLYRHRPMADTWMTNLRKFWQQEPSLRPLTRLLFSLMRFSRRRAEAAYASLPPIHSSEPLEACQLRARLLRAREEVGAWNQLLPEEPGAEDMDPGGTVIKVRRTLWDHIVKVSHELGLSAPQRVRVVPRFDNTGVRVSHGETELVVSPIMLSTREGEARFLVARALYRHAVGLDGLEKRGQTLSCLGAIAERAAAHTEWSCYSREALTSLQLQGVEVEELQVALEELYWQTNDPVYSRLCEVMANRCWCPRAELAADSYAHRFCDMIDATYAVIGTGLDCLPHYRACETSGVGFLIPKLKDYPGLAIRLQSLWMSGFEEVQKQRPSPTR
jgi:hypothetical protein